MKKLFLLTLIIIALILIAVLAIKNKRFELARAKAVGNRPVPVSVVSVRRGNYTKILRYVGIVDPLYMTNVSSRITAEVIDVLYSEGDRVKKGDVIIRLDNRTLKQSVNVLKAKIDRLKTQIAANNVLINSLKASVNYREIQYKRDKSLLEQKIVPKKQVETSEESLNEFQGKLNIALRKGKTLDAELKALQGDMEIAKTNLSYADIYAPFDGVVCQKYVDPGDLAAPGKKLMMLEYQKELKVRFQVPQVDMKFIKTGALLTVKQRKNSIRIKITKIYPAMGSNRMVTVEAAIPKLIRCHFISGEYVKVLLNAGEIKNTFIVPSEAINLDNNCKTKNYLFLVKNGMLKQENITVLDDNDEIAAVKGNLQEGDKVVITAYLGWAELSDGIKAEVIK